MSTCLGLYIEENIIKYAKVSKEREETKVDSFGIKFYDNFNQAIKQIIEETFSYKTPISISLNEEMYNYFQVFSLLNKKDLPRAIKTEFEAFCTEKNYNPNVFETRYAITQNSQDDDKLKVIHISENKIELNKALQNLSGYKLQTITPLSMAIPNVTHFDEKENALIVNIENKTTITTILDRNIYDIVVLDKGSQEILDKINLKENSYQKAYETCKETTIYTSEGNELTEENANYLEDIMPTLYDIVGQVRKVLNSSLDKIDKVYITGTGALINNVDLYFEEYLENVSCEILKPDFVKISPEINIKDYVEVNSAISLALSGLGVGVKGMNFKKTSFLDNLPEILTKDVGSLKKTTKKSDTPFAQWSNKLKEGLLNNKLFKMDFDIPFNKIEKGMLRVVAGLLVLFIVYSGFALMIKNQISQKSNEVDESIKNTQQQIFAAEEDASKLSQANSNYQAKISELNKIQDQADEDSKFKKAIPNLLNKLMYIMPEEVQITSIETSLVEKAGETKQHVVIKAQSSSYAQLGYLTASIKTSAVLTDVISTSGQKSNNIVSIEIEGDLP